MKKIITLSLISLLFNPLTFASERESNTISGDTSSSFDGPYLFNKRTAEKHHKSEQNAYWICDDRLLSTPVKGNRLKRPLSCGQLPEPELNDDAKIIQPDSYTGIEKIVALSDVHGQYDVLIQLLKNQKIIDQNNDWAFGDGHMVMTGDMFDRGHQVNEVLWFMYKLDKQAGEAGGKLHLLMGNHEQMVMRGDLRYVNKRYQVAEKLLNRTYDELYDNSSEIGQWLRSKNTLVKINDSLFLHGGISSEWIDRKLTLAKANTLYRANIDKSKEELTQDPLLNFLFLSNGPTWFRGYFKPDFDETELDQILNYFKVNRVVVGHTSQEQVLGLFNNKVLAVDSSIKNGGSGEVLLMQDNKLTRGLYNGDRIVL
ncbi:metallophosphoesterase [Shewanella sp. D64]|uniref:metallophosphoesterase n=1 Tax=unclassified Shewanella TaxID=196818 RepID=UPI0022BA5A85|nr:MULTISPECIES: metallophosphoesterase [unclassified Shewanella]MEC4728275.1 metallophosphoesterase [Shewanella sp. D64]MEC4739271.1 metallophosphoesterase [Shewanella sp. E94]WBJ97068.1 metallophosphoesterase [Shewanella sp. MTB7]